MTTGCHDNKVLTAAGGPAAGSAVVGLLTRHWSAVRKLAQVLYRDGTAGHDVVLAALGVTDGGGPGSAQLAGLRMGLQVQVRSSRSFPMPSHDQPCSGERDSRIVVSRNPLRSSIRLTVGSTSR